MKFRIMGRVFYIRPWVKYGAISAAACILVFAGYFIKNGKETDISPSPLHTADLTSKTAEITPSPALEVSVYVVGAVKNPGVFQLPKGCLVENAVQAAGGFTEDSDREAVNLVYVIDTNLMIRIPSIEDSDKNWLPGTENGNTAIPSSQSKININTAGIQQLCTLPGVGESTAQKIVNYRTENGPFQTPEEIKNISGIKEAKYEAIKDMICV